MYVFRYLRRRGGCHLNVLKFPFQFNLFNDFLFEVTINLLGVNKEVSQEKLNKHDVIINPMVPAD